MKVVVQGLLTNYLDAGDAKAPVIVLLHGWGASVQNFDSLSDFLARSYRVVRLDLPGFGATQTPPTAWHVRNYAEFVAEFLHKLDITQTLAVVGHSFGGRIVIKGLAEGILPASKAVLLDSAGIKPKKTLRKSAFALTATVGKYVIAAPGLRKFAPGLRSRLYKSVGSDDYLKSGELRQIFLNVINEDLSDDAARIAVPTLLIWGADDLDTPPSDGRALANLIPNSTFSLIAGAGHFVHNDAAKRVCALIEEFLF